MKMPNFFIAGAPRCGTTALAHYLGEHPRVFMSNPKEPAYWCFDAPGLKKHTQVESFDAYQRLFQEAGSQHIAVGEGSTEYLRSSVAIDEILKHDARSRFIVLLRNPIDLVYSFHGIQFFTLSEDEPDFEAAWRLQDRRARGECMPGGCLDPRLIRYTEVGQIGTQLECFIRRVPEDQRMVILFDDFVSETQAVYERVLSFLNVPGDGRTDFPPVFEARRQRFRLVHRFVRRPPPLLAGPVMAVRRAMNQHKTGLIPWVKSRFWKKTSRPPLRAGFRCELQDCFQSEIEKVGELLGRDLSHWK